MKAWMFCHGLGPFAVSIIQTVLPRSWIIDFALKVIKQIKGKVYFESYAPAVSWAAVSLLLNLSAILIWELVHVDYTAAFIQLLINYDVYVKMQKVFLEKGNALYLNRSLYGLCQSSRDFSL